jgi:hypothetical protein
MGAYQPLPRLIFQHRNHGVAYHQLADVEERTEKLLIIQFAGIRVILTIYFMTVKY